MLNLQIFYLSFMTALSYFSPAFFMFTVHIAMEAFRQDVLAVWLSSTVNPTVLDFFVLTIDFIYVLMLSGIIFFSLHFKNSNKYFKPIIYTVSTVFGLFMIIVMGVLLVDVVRGLLTNSTRTHLFTQTSSAPPPPMQTPLTSAWSTCSDTCSLGPWDSTSCPCCSTGCSSAGSSLSARC